MYYLSGPGSTSKGLWRQCCPSHLGVRDSLVGAVQQRRGATGRKIHRWMLRNPRTTEDAWMTRTSSSSAVSSAPVVRFSLSMILTHERLEGNFGGFLILVTASRRLTNEGLSKTAKSFNVLIMF